MVLDSDLAKSPNKYAQPSSYQNINGVIKITGYQSFTINLNDGRIRTDKALGNKAKILSSHIINKTTFSGKTFLDLGGNNGFFALFAINSGATKAKVIDIDKQAIDNVNHLALDIKRANLSGQFGNLSELNEQYDVVNALALIHWIFDLTTGFGSLRKALKFLRKLAKQGLIVEWIDPSDEALSTYKHTELNEKRNTINDYSKNNFLTTLGLLFDNTSFLGRSKPGREIYFAYDNNFAPNFNWAELVHDKSSVIRSGQLTCDESGSPVFSRVYKLDNTYAKQATLFLANNEVSILRELDHPNIPKVLKFSESNEYAYFELSKLPGITLREILRNDIKLEEKEILHIAEGLFDIIKYLNDHSVSHRDISPGNILWCKNQCRVSLIDFGWSIKQDLVNTKPTEIIFTPSELGIMKDFCPSPPGVEEKSDEFAAASLISTLSTTPEVSYYISQLLIMGITNDNKLAATYLRQVQFALRNPLGNNNWIIKK